MQAISKLLLYLACLALNQSTNTKDMSANIALSRLLLMRYRDGAVHSSRQRLRHSAIGVSQKYSAMSLGDLEPLPEKVEVAIIGGGLGGLAVCSAMRARGVDAHVFEAAPLLLRGSTGTGIMISANGFGALDAIDPALSEKMRERGARITRQNIHVCDPSGKELRGASSNATTFLDRYGAEQYNVGWASAHEVLASQVPAEVVHCNCKLDSYMLRQTGDAVDISFEDGRRVQASLLVGADGVGSVVRRLVAGDSACKTRYSGQLLWNAIIPTSEVPNAHALGEVEFTTTGNDGQAILAFDAGEGMTSWYLTLLEDGAPPGVQAALANGSFGGFGRSGRIQELMQAFAPWPVALDLLKATPADKIFERRLADRRPLKSWSDTGKRGGGRVVLMGDAAHPMVPSQGQGTMVTWEDAADLAACILAEKEARGSLAVGVPAAVRRFVSRRAKRCAMVQRFSAKTYMGRPSPKFFKMPRLLKRMRTINRIYGGYEPI